MTISYSDRFWRLLFRWKGSLWKTIYKELLVYLSAFYAIKIIYHFMLNDLQRRKLEAVGGLLENHSRQIPLTFLLGFYVGMVVKRWWEQFNYCSWPDSLMYWVSAYIRGHKEDARIIRKAVARYCILSAILAWRSISLRVLKRFPTEQHLVRCGLMTEEEFEIYSQQEVLKDPHKRWFIPLVWVQSIFVKCAEQKRLSHPNELRTLLSELARFRQGFMKLFIYDWVSIPLVYTHVATIVTYTYFALLLVSRQFSEKVTFKAPAILFATNASAIEGTPAASVIVQTEIDLYVPIFTILQFLFYVGWLKVGEDIMCPFGEDDEDFEFNYLLDRHLEISFLIVDKLHGQVPPLYPDTQTFLDSIGNLHKVLPHTVASSRISNHPPISHLKGTAFTDGEADFVKPPERQIPSDLESSNGAKRKEALSSLPVDFRQILPNGDLTGQLGQRSHSVCPSAIGRVQSAGGRDDKPSTGSVRFQQAPANPFDSLVKTPPSPRPPPLSAMRNAGHMTQAPPPSHLWKQSRSESDSFYSATN